MQIYLNKENHNLLEVAKKNSAKYQNGDPFPNISFDNFFDSTQLSKVLDEFPDLSKENESIRFENSKELKFAGKGELFFGDETKKFMHFLNSELFLKFLQELTGIKETLYSDPYFIGGGQHEIKKGGLLKIHADFNKHSSLGLDRRINVLVYLNKEWKEEYGGHFELWDKNMKECKKKILPSFNKLAIFSTTDFSYHGHPDPLNCPEDRSRKSLALYYYTNGRPSDEINIGLEEHSTILQKRKNSNLDTTSFKKNNIQLLKDFAKEILPPFIFKKLQDKN